MSININNRVDFTNILFVQLTLEVNIIKMLRLFTGVPPFSRIKNTTKVLRGPMVEQNSEAITAITMEIVFYYTE
jgi:hypothetical protein